MQKTLALASFIALAFAAGCASSNTTSDGSMGVVGSESKKSGCCSQKTECTDKPADEGSMGVVSEKSSCETKSNCSAGAPASCPMSGKQN